MSKQQRPGNTGAVAGTGASSGGEAATGRQRSKNKGRGRPSDAQTTPHSPPHSSRTPRTPREAALLVLELVEAHGAYSNLELNRVLREAALSRPDAALATELVYGTLQRQLTLDYWLNRFVAKGVDKLQPWVLRLLRMSVYQLAFLDRIPPHAAVNEAVMLAKRRGHAGISGMVNGVLRAMLRTPDCWQLPAEPDSIKRIALAHSHPQWLVARWIDAYGETETEALCAANNRPPRMSIRVNRQRTSREHALALLAAEGIAAERSKLAADGLVAQKGGNLAELPGFAQGLWSVQDESSMLVAEAANPQPGMQVVDCCAAPGGKTMHLAERMGDQGRVLANELHPHKLRLIEQQAQRLGLACVQTMQSDARVLPEKVQPGSQDVVLLDAPCSGLGVIRRKPEVKWQKQPTDIADIALLQAELLDSAAQLVKPGGLLVYSTCTIEPEENERQVARFLSRNPHFTLAEDWPEQLVSRLVAVGTLCEPLSGSLLLLPQRTDSDGFFIARLRRNMQAD